MSDTFDAAVVGAGILGLAHAYHLARAGKRVVVVERSPRAQGASVRNFGMLWPVGQPPGDRHALAVRSRDVWLDVLQDANLWHDPVGSLHLAYRDDEERVLREFAASAGDDFGCELVPAERIGDFSSAVKRDGLRCALWSAGEVCVDPRAVVAGLPKYLNRTYGVEFRFSTTATSYERPKLRLGDGSTLAANHLFVCSGDDLRTLYPATLANLGLVPCKLQMMRTAARPGWRLGPMLAAGLTLRHYKSFAACPSLPALKARVAAETPEFDRYGIHVMASQNGLGELVLGDSHEYGSAIEPFDKAEIDDLILNYLTTFLDVPDVRVAVRWHGIYMKHPSEPYQVVRPADGVVAAVGLGGAGMTLSFGLAERVVAGG